MATASPSGLPHAVKPCVGRGPLPPPEKSMEDGGKGGFDSRHPLHSKPLEFQPFRLISNVCPVSVMVSAATFRSMFLS